MDSRQREAEPVERAVRGDGGGNAEALFSECSGMGRTGEKRQHRIVAWIRGRARASSAPIAVCHAIPRPWHPTAIEKVRLRPMEPRHVVDVHGHPASPAMRDGHVGERGKERAHVAHEMAPRALRIGLHGTARVRQAANGPRHRAANSGSPCAYRTTSRRWEAGFCAATRASRRGRDLQRAQRDDRLGETRHDPVGVRIGRD